MWHKREETRKLYKHEGEISFWINKIRCDDCMAVSYSVFPTIHVNTRPNPLAARTRAQNMQLSRITKILIESNKQHGCI